MNWLEKAGRGRRHRRRYPDDVAGRPQVGLPERISGMHEPGAAREERGAGSNARPPAVAGVVDQATHDLGERGYAAWAHWHTRILDLTGHNAMPIERRAERFHLPLEPNVVASRR